MTTYHLTDESKAFLRRFGPYIGEEIDVYCPGRRRYGRLMGLPYCEPAGRPKADVLLYYTDTEVAEEVLFDCVEDMHNVLPCLYAFEDLPNELPDGKVAAAEVAKLEGDAPHMDAEFRIEAGCYLSARPRGGFWHVWREYRWLHTGQMSLATAALLRSLGFAVGLAPHEFHRKTTPVIALQ